MATRNEVDNYIKESKLNYSGFCYVGFYVVYTRNYRFNCTNQSFTNEFPTLVLQL